MRLQFVAILFFALSIGPSAYAQGCNAILGLTQNIDVEHQSIRAAKAIKDNYCSGNSVNSDRNFSASLEVLVQKVPLGFKVGSGSTRETVQNVCSSFDEWARNNHDIFTASISANDRAIEAWETCIRVQAGGDVEYDLQLSKETVLVQLQRGRDVVEFQGAHYNKDAMRCFGPFGANGDEVDVDTETRYSIQSAVKLPLTCERKFRAGTDILPRTDLVVRVPGNSLLIPLSEDRRAGTQFASDLKRQIASLEGELSEKTSRVEDLQVEASTLRRALDCGAGRLREFRNTLPIVWKEWKRIAGTYANHGVRNLYIGTFMESPDHGSTDLKMTRPQLEVMLDRIKVHVENQHSC